MTLITDSIQQEDGYIYTKQQFEAYLTRRPFYFSSTQDAVMITNQGTEDLIVGISGVDSLIKPGMSKAFKDLKQFEARGRSITQQFEVQGWTTQSLLPDDVAGKAQEAMTAASTALKEVTVLSTQSFPMNFTLHPDPIIELPPGVTQLGMPWVLPVYRFLKDRIADYYMYCAPHDDPGGIYFFTSNDPRGPFIYQKVVLSREDFGIIGQGHVSSPCVVWKEEEQRFYFYFHALNKAPIPYQYTYVGYTLDGINNIVIESEEPIIDPAIDDEQYDSQYSTYAQFIRYQDKWLGFYQGSDLNPDKKTKICGSYSEDGKKYRKFLNNPILGAEGNEIYTAHPAPFVLNGVVYLVYHVYNPGGIHLAVFDGEKVKRLGQLIQVPSTGWNSGKLGYPSVMMDGDKIYIYYGAHAVKNTTSDETMRIGVAYAEVVPS